MTRLDRAKAAGVGGGASTTGGGGGGALQPATPRPQRARLAIKAERMGAIDVMCPAVLARKRRALWVWIVKIMARRGKRGLVDCVSGVCRLVNRTAWKPIPHWRFAGWPRRSG